MDVALAPFTASRGETSPLKVVDSLACARPVVVSAIAAVVETAAPASINCRAGACDRLPRKIIVAGRSTATVVLAASARIPGSEIAAR